MESKPTPPPHLPLFGAGPAYVITITVMTTTALALHYTDNIPYIPLQAGLHLAFQIVGGLLFLEGVALWLSAVFSSKLTKKIKEGQLITTGVYGIVRHPIYSAFMLAEWGLLIGTGNLLLLLLLPMYWVFLTLLVHETEEKWLEERFGTAYKEYCKRVHRCIPWFPKKKI